MTKTNLTVGLADSKTDTAPSGAAASDRGIELAVIVPTYNERDNVKPLIELLESTLLGISWEVIFVDDDSPDQTSDLLREIGRTKPNVRCVQRIDRRGLSSAVIEGMLSSNAPYIAIMDADLQHDERLLPDMFDALKNEELDLVVASRFVPGGDAGGLTKERLSMSQFAAKISRIITKAKLSDPMSGFFMIRRDAFDQIVRNLSGQGFKILLDLFASAPQPLRYKELPYQFKKRLHGESKLDTLVLWEYLLLVIDKSVGHILPVRFVMFAMVGGTGTVLHMFTLWLGLQSAGLSFFWSQVTATAISMTSNFVLNNFLTYRDMRLRGWGYLRGLISFYLVGSVGAIANIGIANVIFESNYQWWFAGGAGVIVGVVWNYAASSIFTWRK